MSWLFFRLQTIHTISHTIVDQWDVYLSCGVEFYIPSGFAISFNLCGDNHVRHWNTAALPLDVDGCLSGHVDHQHGRTKTIPGPRFNTKMSSYQYMNPHCGDKTIVRSSYLHNGISYTGKMSFLYWIRAQVIAGDKSAAVVYKSYR